MLLVLSFIYIHWVFHLISIILTLLLFITFIQGLFLWITIWDIFQLIIVAMSVFMLKNAHQIAPVRVQNLKNLTASEGHIPQTPLRFASTTGGTTAGVNHHHPFKNAGPLYCCYKQMKWNKTVICSKHTQGKRFSLRWEKGENFFSLGEQHNSEEKKSPRIMV